MCQRLSSDSNEAAMLRCVIVLTLPRFKEEHIRFFYFSCQKVKKGLHTCIIILIKLATSFASLVLVERQIKSMGGELYRASTINFPNSEAILLLLLNSNRRHLRNPEARRSII